MFSFIKILHTYWRLCENLILKKEVDIKMKNKIITELPKKKRADKEIIEWSKVENTVIVGIYEGKEYGVLIKGIDPKIIT